MKDDVGTKDICHHIIRRYSAVQQGHYAMMRLVRGLTGFTAGSSRACNVPLTFIHFIGMLHPSSQSSPVDFPTDHKAPA